MPRCCLNFQSMRTQAESTYIAHNMFGQIKMEIPWYINWHTLIYRKRDGKLRMIGGQFVVVRVGVHQISVSPNTSHPMLQICSKLLHGNSMPSLNSTYIWITMVGLWLVWALVESLSLLHAGDFQRRLLLFHIHAVLEKRSAIEQSSRHLNEAV